MAKKKMNFRATADRIVELVGGVENINIVTHCMTRLRLVLKDESVAKTEEIKALDGILSVVKASGQYQVIVGNDVIHVYNEMVKNHNIQTGGEVEAETAPVDKKSVKYWWNAFLDYVTGTMTQTLPVIICAGMISVVLALATNVFGVSTDNMTYKIFNYVYNAGFYFLPVYVGFAAAKKLGATPLLGAFMGAILIHPTYVSMVSAGDAISIFGLPVTAIPYTSTVIPMLLIVLVMAQVEKLINKYIPGALKTTFAPVLVALIMVPLALLVIGPAGYTIGSTIVQVFMWIYNVSPFLIIPVAAMLWPILVMFGAHTLLVPTMTELLATVGFDAVVRPGAYCSNFAILGVCLAIAYKSKEFRGVSLSAAASAVFGVTEPGLYGVIIPLKKTVIAMMGGSFLGGCVAALLGVHAYIMAANSILSLPMFGDTLIGAVISIVVSVVSGFVLTLLLGFDENAAA